MTMARFFEAAMRREGHEIITVGPYSGDDGSIPWPGSPMFPQYVDKPTIVLPEMLSAYPVAALKPQLPSDIDAVFSFDAGFRLTGKLDGVPNVLYGTDPHALNYAQYLGEYDYFFCAQNMLMGKQPLPPGAMWIPLAYDPTVHRCDQPIDKTRLVDCTFIGVMGEGPGRDNAYHQRWQATQTLKGWFNTFFQTGLIFEECTQAYNQSKIAFNWSSSWDIPMRAWEAWGYSCCLVTNRLPFLEDVGFIDGETCVMFDTLEELVPKIREVLDSGLWQEIAKNGHEMGTKLDATYDQRVRMMLEVIGG